MDAIAHEDEGLWNELSEQQSREIQQHHARTAAASRTRSNRHPPAVVIQQMFRQTAQEMSRLTSVFYEAATSAWREHQERQRQREQSYSYRTTTGHTNNNNNNPTTNYLDEFGIPKEEQEYTPLFDDDETRHEGGENENGGFIFLPRLRNRTEGWGAAANLDVYFSSLYSYYYSRGLVPIVGKGIVELVTLFFTLFLSVFLFAYVDWNALSQCTDESSCHANFVDSYLIKHPFSQQGRWSVWNIIVILYCLLFAAYGMFAAWTFLVHTVGEALNAKWVFEERLGISARKLEGGAVDWDRDVVSKLRELQQQGEYRIAIHGQGDALDALIVAQRILRKENFLVAFFNRGLIDLSVPVLGNNFFCSSIEWSLYFCILNFMFNHKYEVRPAFYLDPAALRRRFMVCGVAHVVFMPFLLFFLTLHFGLQNAYDWKSTKRYLGPREWSLSSKWVFREFNELQHNFERRLAPSYEAAEVYLKLFGHNEAVVALGRILVFIGGSLGAVLFLFAAMNDAILLHVKIADWNLLWYVGLVGVVYSAGKAMLPNDEAMPRSTRNVFAETDAALANVAKHTHYYPETWKGRGSDEATRKSVSSMFKYKAQLFAMEVASVIVAPYILCVSLAKCAEPICEFVLAIKAEVAGAGEVCGFATFDFDRYGDETWDQQRLGSGQDHPLAGTLTESILRIGSVAQVANHFPVPKARHGKMEKSFFSFKAAHPNWKCHASGQHLVDRVENYRREETAALSREQELHIEAAARQLETLAHLEQQRPYQEPPIRVVDESYIPKAHAPADAGAGMRQPYMPPSPTTHPDVVQDLSIHRSSLHQPLSESLQVHDKEQEQEQQESLQPPFALSSNATSLPRSLSSVLTQGNRSSAIPAAAGGNMSVGLSSELKRILNLSTLIDPDVSVSSTSLAVIGDHHHHHQSLAAEDGDHRAERQYMWLERYHAHVAAQQQQREQHHLHRSTASLLAPTPHRQRGPDEHDDDENPPTSASSMV